MEDFIEKWDSYLIGWLLSHGLKIVIIGFSVFILNKIAKKLITKVVRLTIISDHYSSVDAKSKREETLVRVFVWTCSIVIWIMGFLMILQEVGIPIGPILAGAGIIGLAVGFGGQYLIKDVISGFFIIMENQYRIGDVVNFDSTSGLVEDISLRMTTLRDLDGTVHHVPHGEIKKVSNLSKYFSRINLNIGIGYSSDLEHVIEVVNRVGNELSNDPIWRDFIIKPPQFLRIDDFGDSSIVIKILGETKPLKQWDVAGELRKRIKLAFDLEQIEIPFPQRVVNIVKN